MSPVTAALVVLNVGLFVQQAFAPALTLSLALWPIGGAWLFVPQAGFAPYQVVTYAFLHGSVPHLLFNMLGLYMFGAPLERALGPKRFVFYYLACVVSAAITQLVVLGIAGTFVPTVGASGGVFGLLLAYAVMFPHHRIMLLFPPIPMPARRFAALYAGIELALGIVGTSSGVAHFAHLGGMIGGFLLLRGWHVRAMPGEARERAG
jgi:membrane associated rhomboid family serine protease